MPLLRRMELNHHLRSTREEYHDALPLSYDGIGGKSWT